jgi:uncharacterized Zn finger protein
MAMPEKELGPWSARCPHCGKVAEVEITGVDAVVVDCPDCGPFEAGIEAFDEQDDPDVVL